MNILMITENDPAGMGIAFTRAINRHTEHRCRLITTKTLYNFNFEKDLHVPDLDEEGFEEIVQLLKGADIIHFHILADENIELGPIKVRDYVRHKTIVHHHHGHPHFRAHPEIYREKYRRLRRKALVSTPDLLHLLPEATWQPNLVPIHDPLFLPQPAPINGRVTIGQSVTRKDIKNTDDLMRVVGKIQKEIPDPKLSLDIIENTDYRECLRRKNKCHIVFDHMQGYYGVSSLESLSQGKPVIAGLDHWNLSHINEFTGTAFIPWVLCRTREELEETIPSLAGDADYLEWLGRESRTFMCRHWSDQIVAGMLMHIYSSC
jgi:hypothetical protein